MKYVCALVVVKDIQIARNFYENLLGQKVKFDFGENITFEGDFAIHLEEHYIKLLGERNSQILRRSNNFELYFETEELDSLLKMLEEKR